MIQSSLSPVANISVKGDVVSRTVGDDMILLDLESGTYYTLNSVGAVIWKELERGAARDGVLDAVAAAVVVPAAIALALPGRRPAGGRARDRRCDASRTFIAGPG